MSVHKDTATGKWKVRYRIGTKQHAKSGFQTKREAEAYEAEQLRRVRNGIWTDPAAARVTVLDVFSDWIAAKQAEPRTIYGYRGIWIKRIAPDWAQVRLRDVTPAGVQRWASKLAASYSPSGVNQALTVLN